MRIQHKFSKQKLCQNSLTAIPEKRNKGPHYTQHMWHSTACVSKALDIFMRKIQKNRD